MTRASRVERIRAAWHSIRWRLPLSYAAIALLTAVVLGGLLLITLDDYYNRQERAYLRAASGSIIRQVETMTADELTAEQMNNVVRWLSFLTQTRVQVLDLNQQITLDSGPVEAHSQISVDFTRWQESDRPPDEPGGAGPFLSLSTQAVTGGASGVSTAAGSPGPDNTLSPQGPPPEPAPMIGEGSGDALSYPIHIRRGPFGQVLSESASPTDRTSQRVSTPIIGQDGEPLGYLVLSEGPAFGNEIVGDVAEKGIVAAALAILIAILAGVVISRNISRPVIWLAEATGRMARGDFAVSVPLHRRDEFGMLAQAFETMARRIESTITTLKQFVADAAHELNTPLTALRTNLELTTAYDMPAQAADDIHQALVELNRLERLTNSLLVLARLESADRVPVRQPVDMGALVRQMIERCASRADQAGIELDCQVPQEPVMVMGDREQLIRVLDNLFDNALKFTPAQGRVSLAVERDHDLVQIGVRDTGIGIPAEDMARLFSRFHRGRNAAAFPGNGLGLVIAKAIVTDHGGQITVDNNGGTGTCFTVTLPAAAPAAAEEDINPS